MSGIDEIAAERRRQIEKEGWSADHDDDHPFGTLAAAAAAYAWLASLHPDDRRRQIKAFRIKENGILAVINELWPRSWADFWLKPKNARRDLIRAGALIAAELDRLDRTAR